MGTFKTEVRLLKYIRKGILMRGISPTEEIIKNKCKELHLEYVEMYKTKHDTRVKYFCSKHKDKGILDSAWCHLKNAKYGCKYCIGRDRKLEEFKQMIDETKINFLSDYIGFEKNIKCQCTKCGYIWKTMPKTLAQGKYYCPKCAHKINSIKRCKTHEEFENELFLINPNITLLGRYHKSKDKIKCKCNICGYEWNSKASNLIHEQIRCPACSSSKSEDLLAHILDKLGFIYKRQVSFSECRYKLPLRFDFIIYDDSGAILFACEYDGEQHYKPITYNNKTSGENSLLQTQIRDSIKNEYCKQCNIPLIRIPYWEKDNMESFLCNKIKELNLEYILTKTVETAG